MYTAFFCLSRGSSPVKCSICNLSIQIILHHN
ncbi:MAG: hypothetical protein KBH85_02615 [Lachnospiraceae bacterium]|nr:hypothetical protein [Lachnospiraceae bacterium]